MSKDEIFLVGFLYVLVILISVSISSFGSQAASLPWIKTLVIRLKEPVCQEGQPERVTVKPDHLALLIPKPVHGLRKTFALPQTSLNTVKKIPAKTETTKTDT